MKSIGECMAIGRNFKESFLKAVRSLEVGLIGLDVNPKIEKMSKSEIIEILKKNIPNKYLIIAQAIRKGIKLDKISKASNYDDWFVYEINGIVETENLIKKRTLDKNLYLRAKSEGFSDEKIISLKKKNMKIIQNLRKIIN